MPMLNLRHQLRKEPKNKRTDAAGPKTEGCFLPRIAQSANALVNPESLKKTNSSTNCRLPTLQHVPRPPTRGKCPRDRTLSQKVHLPKINDQKQPDLKPAVKYCKKSNKGIRLPPIDTGSAKGDSDDNKRNNSNVKTIHSGLGKAEEIKTAKDKLDAFIPRPPTRGKPSNTRSSRYLPKDQRDKAPNAIDNVQILDLTSTSALQQTAKQPKKIESTDNNQIKGAIGDVKENYAAENKSTKDDFLTQGMANHEPVLGKPPINPNHKPNKYPISRRTQRRRGASHNSGVMEFDENRSQKDEAEKKRFDALVNIFDNLVQAALDAKD